MANKQYSEKLSNIAQIIPTKHKMALKHAVPFIWSTKESLNLKNQHLLTHYSEKGSLPSVIKDEEISENLCQPYSNTESK